MQQFAAAAQAMPTTLWFDNDEQQNNLIAAGQETLCYNLIKYVYRCNGEDGQCRPQDDAIWKRLLADWQRFNDDPYWLVNQLAIKNEPENRPGK